MYGANSPKQWDTIVMRKPVAKPKSAAVSQKSILSKYEEKIDGDVKVINPYLDATNRNVMVQARVALKMSQKDLATRCNLDQKYIQDLEQGKPIPIAQSSHILQKVKKILGIKDLSYTKS